MNSFFVHLSALLTWLATWVIFPVSTDECRDGFVRGSSSGPPDQMSSSTHHLRKMRFGVVRLMPEAPRIPAGRDFLEVTTPTFALQIHVFAGKLQIQAATSSLENVYNAVLASTLHAGQVRDLH